MFRAGFLFGLAPFRFAAAWETKTYKLEDCLYGKRCWLSFVFDHYWGREGANDIFGLKSGLELFFF